jgi:uncharacterized protein with HEPN domain
MLAEERDSAYLWDMLEAARSSHGFIVNETIKNYLESKLLRSAVERQLEIIGEAAGKVSNGFREEHPEIPWKKIISQRNVIAHEYGEIMQELIWVLVTNLIPDLITHLEPWLIGKPR